MYEIILAPICNAAKKFPGAGGIGRPKPKAHSEAH
jgi:hypothetical protein